MFGSLILGAGPGGTGPLVWAAQNGKLQSWLTAGVAIVDRSDSMGGTLGRYAINSDSFGGAYLECLDAAPARELFMPLRSDPVTKELEPMRHGLPPLDLVDRYLHRLGDRLQQIVSHYPSSRFFPRTEARALHLRADGAIVAETLGPDGSIDLIEARTAIMALGGRQDRSSYLGAELMPGVRLAGIDQEKIIPSDALMTTQGQSRMAALLKRGDRRRVLILGGSHSAFSIAWVLTNMVADLSFGPGEVAILLRRPPRIFYESEDAATADGYEILKSDVCPRTRRVNRLGGLRGNGREMWRRLTRRPGTVPEERVVMLPLSEPHLSNATLRKMLDDAAVIVPAFGYRASTVPIFDAEARRLPLKADSGGPAVGRDARVLLADGRQLPNVFGIGLGTDFRPWGKMGGEPSFDGQANSLWLYQNDIGAVVYRGVQEYLDAAKKPRRAWRDGRFVDVLARTLGPGAAERRVSDDAVQTDVAVS
jgi:hypothetical protein